MNRLGWVAALFVGIVAAGVLSTHMRRGGRLGVALPSADPTITPDAAPSSDVWTTSAAPAPTPAAPPDSGGHIGLWLLIGVGVLLAAMLALVAYTLWRDRIPARASVASAAGPAPVVTRWHCILEAHTATRRVVLRRGVVEFPAQGHRQVEREVVGRYISTYGPPPPGTRYHCSAAPMVTA